MLLERERPRRHGAHAHARSKNPKESEGTGVEDEKRAGIWRRRAASSRREGAEIDEYPSIYLERDAVDAVGRGLGDEERILLRPDADARELGRRGDDLLEELACTVKGGGIGGFGGGELE